MLAGVRGAVIGVVFGVLGCAEPEPKPLPEPAEFAQLCGAAGPVRVLAFEPWRWVERASQWGVFGERRVFRILYGDTEHATGAVWSTGLCGEDPRQLYVGELSSLSQLSDPQLPLVCAPERGGLIALDPRGERAPALVFPAAELPCFLPQIEAGRVYLEPDLTQPESGTLMLLRWPADPWAGPVAPEPVHEGVHTYLGVPDKPMFGGIWPDDTGVFVLELDAELVRVELADPDAIMTELIAPDVAEFALGRDASGEPRYAIWQQRGDPNEGEGEGEGELVLLDRETDERFELGPGALGSSPYAPPRHPFAWSARGLLLLSQREGEAFVARLHRLDTREPLAALPPGFRYEELLADGRHLLAERDDGVEGLFEIESGEWTPLADAGLTRWWPALQALALLPEASAERPRVDSALWIEAGDGRELVAERASYVHAFLADGRLLSAVGLDDEGVGDLLVIDPDTLAERLIAVGVSDFAGPEQAGDEDLILYGVYPPNRFGLYSLDADRDGVWMVRLPPRE